MKTLSAILLVVVFGEFGDSRPQLIPSEATIIQYENDNNGIDGYSYVVETSDGQFKSEQGTLQNIGTENELLTVRGQYSYTGPDGVLYTVAYIADENGYEPQGPHILLN